MKFTFDPAKYHKIFDKLLKLGYIQLSHTLPSLEELKRRAYYNVPCKIDSPPMVA
jgi:hypothetical protein